MPRPLLVLLLVVSPALADTKPARDHDITLDDYATLASITDLAVSPDGKHVAYCESRWDTADDTQKADLWVVRTDGSGKPTRLSGDRANDRKPKWAADGKAVYVLANRKREAETKPPYNGSTQVWRVPLDGGDPRAVTRVDGGVTGFDYSPKADILFYSKDTSATDKDEFADLRSKYKAEYGHGTRKTAEVYRLDLQSWRTEKVAAEGRYVREFAATQDGKRLAMVTAIDDTVAKSEGESRVDVWEGGKVVTPPTAVYRKDAASPYAWLENLCWNPDGDKFAFNAIHDAYPAEVIVGKHGPDGWAVSRLKRDGWEVINYGRGIGAPLQWSSAALYGLAERAGYSSLFRAESDSPTGEMAGPKPESIIGFTTNALRGGWYVLSGPDRFPILTQSSTTLVDPNPHTASWKLPSVKHITWKALDGTEVGGVLELPADYKKGDKLPLVVGIHGGPTASSKAELRYDPHNGRLYFAAHGYAALYPNYRGSTGYGDKFLTDLIGRENDVEVKDILAGIQHLIKEGIADPDKVGVMGWSNGGYLTNCLITLKDPPVKIKAASSGAGIVDGISEWGFNDEPAFTIVFQKGLPWETPDSYRKASPAYGIGNVTTPTLIHVGGGDERCPPGHSRMLYRALKDYQKVPTELVVYPNEPHGLTKLSHRKAKMAWDLAWFDKYLKGKK